MPASRDVRDPAPKWAPGTVERSPYGPLDVGDELSPASTSGGWDSEVRQKWHAYSDGGAFGSVEPNVKTAAGAEDTARAYGVLPRRVVDDYDDVDTSVRPRIIDAETIISFAAAAASPAKFESSEVPTAKRVDPSPPPRRALDFAHHDASTQRARTGSEASAATPNGAEMAKEQARDALLSFLEHKTRLRMSRGSQRRAFSMWRALAEEAVAARLRPRPKPSPPAPPHVPAVRPATPPESPPRTYEETHPSYGVMDEKLRRWLGTYAPASEPELPGDVPRRAHHVAGSGASLDTLETLVEALHAAEDRVRDVEAENEALGNDLYAASVVMEEMQAECAALREGMERERARANNWEARARDAEDAEENRADENLKREVERLEEYAKSLRVQWPAAVERAARKMRQEEHDARGDERRRDDRVDDHAWN